MTTKQLYEVSADLIMYVMAESKLKAERIGKFSLNDELDNAEVFAHKANSILSIWSDSVPYGSDDNRTCGEIIAEQIETEKKLLEQKEYEANTRKGKYLKN